MSSLRRALLLFPVALVLVVAGCSIGDDGPRTTQARDVAAFTRIENRDSVDVRLRVGDPQRLRVLAGEKVIDDVRTEVRDGTLLLTFDRDGIGGNDVVVEASVPELTGVEASGSGDIDAEGIDADAFQVRSDGSGDIALEGTARRLTVESDGSGDTDLARLVAREARVVVDGSGDLDVRADERLDVNVAGSGDVRYYGDPALTHYIDGSGELSQTNQPTASDSRTAHEAAARRHVCWTIRLARAGVRRERWLSLLARRGERRSRTRRRLPTGAAVAPRLARCSGYG